MKKIAAILPLVLTVIIVYSLNKPIGSVPALGKVLNPISGFWASAEPVGKDLSKDITFQSVHDKTDIWFDDRMVPHITATNDYDLYFAQGYLHACFRLWQMDLQSKAAAGRVSELLGDKALTYDRRQRRKGMVYGAEKSLRAMEAEPRTKVVLDAYRDGINEYISSLGYKDYPVEYKLMGFAPERWENINTALLLMYMADDLTGDVHDIGLSYYMQNVLTAEELDFYFPEKVYGSTPVIPSGTKFDSVSLIQPPVPQGDIWAKLDFKKTPKGNSESGKGSNNWALSGSRTKSGKPILCNDPHLALNLPALWFQVQLTAPGINVYGVSLPGAPGVVIGFNDSLSWGFTNNYRDVKDFYTIDKIDDNNYRFNGAAMAFDKRIETIKIKGKPDFIDKVNYTLHGPVLYDDKFKQPDGIQQPLALKWMALTESNELLSLYLLNRAKNYDEYVTAINYFLCPAQNFIYADVKGNIALWGQGQFVNKWKDQGKYIMQGYDSTTLWGDLIPVSENPHVLNPEQGFLSSANQNVTDSTYPYWFNGRFNELRAWRINEVLDTIQDVTVQDMFSMQGDVHSVLARKVTKLMLDAVVLCGVNDEYVEALLKWDYNYASDSKAATVFQLWWSEMYKAIWADKFKVTPDGLLPLPERTMQIILSEKEQVKGLDKIIVSSYAKVKDSLEKLKAADGLEWYKVKNTSLNHLAKLKPFSYTEMKNGGWGNTINAMKGNHGPSWRMVVEMKDVPEGYGVYPGGQSGNPGSKYYATFIDKWTKGEVDRLTFVSAGQQPETDMVKYTWTIKPANK